MRTNSPHSQLQDCLSRLTRHDLSPLDILGDGSLAEKMIGLVLAGPPGGGGARLTGLFQDTLARINEIDTRSLRVVILGGGTGLSNIIGGDSLRSNWPEDPFTGLKEIFPHATSIVCATDDGGSTGELLKDLPLIALGDLRHVLLSSIRSDLLRERYNLDEGLTRQAAAGLHAVVNHRFSRRPAGPQKLAAASGLDKFLLPPGLRDYLLILLGRLFDDVRLQQTLNRPQCLGNLLLASAIFGYLDPGRTCAELAGDQESIHRATLSGIAELGARIGVAERGVLPCITTPARLQFFYANGVLVTGENKSGHARRSYPVDRALMEFLQNPFLPAEVSGALRAADIIVFAPGSLYSSIIPILQVPGLAALIRENSHALKILVANIWVQKGETDFARDAPQRKFHVSDLVRAYNRNIPDGVTGLFPHVLSLGLGEIPGAVLQRYALEDKEPIYLDRLPLREIGFEPVEAGIFSAEFLRLRGVIQHDPRAVAQAVRTLWCLKGLDASAEQGHRNRLAPSPVMQSLPREDYSHPCIRFAAIRGWLVELPVFESSNGPESRRILEGTRRTQLLSTLEDILWRHQDILLSHLQFIRGIVLVDTDNWSRCQEWDNVFSFFAPEDGMLMFRADQTERPARLEMAFLVALGESLLGNYAERKVMADVHEGGERVGRIYNLVLRDPEKRSCFLRPAELDAYLSLARMQRSAGNPRLYTRLVNADEGFTPPGLLFGLFYTWYLDNRYASHIEYKMSIMRNTVSDLIPEQAKIVRRREGLIDFFRDTVFLHRQAVLNAKPSL